MGAVGRNDPCPCGSGSKYKRCCLAKDEARLADARLSMAEGTAAPSPPWGTVAPPFRGPSLSPPLQRRVAEVERLFLERGLSAPSFEDEDEQQRLFQSAALRRWERAASADPALVAARADLLLADHPRFTKEYQEGLRERAAAVEPTLRVLRTAGEAAVPHLAIRMMEDTWASVVAGECLAGMPSGPWRNRAVVEALFVSGDWLPEVAIVAVCNLGLEERWAAFEAVARSAAEDGVGLHGPLWAGLFEDGGGDPEAPTRPTPQFGRALRMLYDLGHAGALSRGVEAMLDPMMDGPESVALFLNDPGFQEALGWMRARPPRSGLARNLPLMA